MLSIKLGTTFKNLLFIFCDFIKHPIISIISDNTSKATRKIKTILKVVYKVKDIIFSKSLI